jgi:hypothetical protein
MIVRYELGMGWICFKVMSQNLPGETEGILKSVRTERPSVYGAGVPWSMSRLRVL